jgi:hypothetical protein
MKPEISIYSPRPKRFNIDALKVQQEEGMHDMFTAYLARPGLVDTEDLKGYPCTVTWNNRFAVQTLHGYVDTTSNMTEGFGATGMVIIGLGASSVLRNGQARTWRRSTPHRIARNIVAPYRMGLVTDKYISTIDSFMQTSDSDWGALRRLGDLTGMALVATNTTIRMIDVRRAIGRSEMRSVPVYASPDSFVQMETPSPAGFDSFEFTGIDALGVNFTLAGGQEGGVKRHASQNFSSLEEARLASDRHQDRQRQYVRAAAEFSGQLAIKCGDVCEVEGLRWFVSKCSHEVRIDSSKSSVAVELHRATVSRPSSTDAPAIPESVLSNGKWSSARRFEVEL